MKKIIAPSILSADFKVLGEQVQICKESGAEYLHFDVMDGLFVPSISFGMPVLQSIRNAADIVMDVHLMITEPIRYVEAFHAAGADILTVHYEACEDLQATLDAIHNCGMKAGITIKPGTSGGSACAISGQSRDVSDYVGRTGIRRTGIYTGISG